MMIIKKCVLRAGVLDVEEGIILKEYVESTNTWVSSETIKLRWAAKPPYNRQGAEANSSHFTVKESSSISPFTWGELLHIRRPHNVMLSKLESFRIEEEESTIQQPLKLFELVEIQENLAALCVHPP
jgi:hypothetical protein